MKNSQPNRTWNFSRELSDRENQIYLHSFPIIRDKNNGRITIMGEFIYNESTKTIRTNVYDVGTGNMYAPYYDREYGDFSIIVNMCIDAINKEMKRLGIKKCQ